MQELIAHQHMIVISVFIVLLFVLLHNLLGNESNACLKYGLVMLPIVCPIG